MPQLTEAQAAYLAGLVDGEGTVSIVRAKRSDGMGKRAYYYRATVQIANTNLDLILRFRELLGGHAYIKTHNPGRARTLGHRLCYIAQVPQGIVSQVLPMLRPWLVAKAQQADLVMRFCGALNSAIPNALSPDHELYEEMYMQSRTLNTRGVHASPDGEE